MSGYLSQNEENLYAAILSLRTEEECRAFFSDLLTRKEIAEFSSRLEVARLLQKKVNYNDIVAATGASTATISRVSKALAGEEGGYRTALARTFRETERDPSEQEIAIFASLDDEQRRALLHLGALLARGQNIPAVEEAKR